MFCETVRSLEPQQNVIRVAICEIAGGQVFQIRRLPAGQQNGQILSYSNTTYPHKSVHYGDSYFGQLSCKRRNRNTDSQTR
jgi:uncharacterized membrane protein